MFHALASAVLAAVLVTPLLAQLPVGRTHADAGPLQNVATLRVPALDRQTLAAEDVVRAANGQPARFAVSNTVRVSPATHGTWERLDATWSLWRLRIEAPGADHVNLGFRNFHMPGDARMQFYSADYQHVQRAFDAADHQPTGQLWTPIVRGDRVVCELYVRTAQRDLAQLDLVHVGSGYRFFGAGPTAVRTVLTDGSGSCNVDVNCPQGLAWKNESAAVAAVSVGGSLFCCGCMINNTAQDGRNFFLTAKHCGIHPGTAPSLVCYWNYDAVSCGNSNAPLNQFTIGATWRAAHGASDFTLVELNSTPNPAWGVTYAGWNRAPNDASSAVAIHHPNGDAKKISFEYQATETTLYSSTTPTPNGTHVRVVDWDLGTTEGGSSGSPLFDQHHRIIGQLHGGFAACGNDLSDWYGRFYTSWTGGGTDSSRLSNWLDPLHTGQLTLDTLGGSDIATAIAYGEGCYTSYGTFYEEFAGGSFDLSGLSVLAVNVRLTPTANLDGYTVDFGNGAWFTPLSPDLGLGDDDISSQTLPFAFAHPGGTTQVINFCSNGYAWLDGTTTTADPTPTVHDLVQGPARLAPCWLDLDPTAGGSCHYDAQPGVVYFTWLDVPARASGPAGAGNSMQLAIFQNGVVEYRYRVFADQPDTAITAFTRGGGALTPPAVDLSASLPLSVSSDRIGLAWTGINRPLLGTTQFLELSNIQHPTLSIGLVVAGWTGIPGGADLGAAGAPGCDLYAQAQVVVPMAFAIPGNRLLWSLPIPNSPTLSGTSLYTKGALLEDASVGSNQLGARTSNGVELRIGTQ